MNDANASPKVYTAGRAAKYPGVPQQRDQGGHRRERERRRHPCEHHRRPEQVVHVGIREDASVIVDGIDLSARREGVNDERIQAGITEDPGQLR